MRIQTPFEFLFECDKLFREFAGIIKRGPHF